jgi:hypothetical protein
MKIMVVFYSFPILVFLRKILFPDFEIQDGRQWSTPPRRDLQYLVRVLSEEIVSNHFWKQQHAKYP